MFFLQREEIEAALRVNNSLIDDSVTDALGVGGRAAAGMGRSSIGESWQNPPLDEQTMFSDLNNPNMQQNQRMLLDKVRIILHLFDMRKSELTLKTIKFQELTYSSFEAFL